MVVNFSGLLIGAKDFSTRTDSIPLFNRVREIVERFVNPSVLKYIIITLRNLILLMKGI